MKRAKTTGKIANLRNGKNMNARPEMVKMIAMINKNFFIYC